ncbi:hypothetical protein VHEMI05336 [[Torrubiella] hemipterigena]|uniref:Peptidase M3A/M3B catalytic domain-containing protein n=1 Tax=[Torrubiella] hemipterigena TaxID=1531966 RepID=A0A0A1TGD7_9HYPO|nr:hypothetical protein VHEMI05336 [[Torrubiella] hemipterigena]
MAQALPTVPDRNDFVPTMEEYVQEHRKILDRIVSTVKPSDVSFENVLLPIGQLENEYGGRKAVIEALRYASPEEEVQEEVDVARKVRQKYSNEVSERIDYYELLQALKDKGELQDFESRTFLDKSLQNYTSRGYGIVDAQTIKTFNEVQAKCNDLCAEYNKNIRLMDPKACGIDFTKEELDGLPEDLLSQCEVQPDGRLRVPLQQQYSGAIKQHVHNGETRKRIMQAFNSKHPENGPLFREIILLRDENARRLGLKSRCEFKLPYRMIESVEWVQDLLVKLWKPMSAERRKLFDAQLAKKREILYKEHGTAPEEVQLETWDTAYYQNIIDREAKAVDEDLVREYFPFLHTFDYMLRQFSTYFQLAYVEIPKDELVGHVWSSDIRVWGVWDKRPDHMGEFIGYLYADLFSRPNKYKGNQAVNLQPGYLNADGSRVYPATTIMCNFALRERHGCALMAHSQMTTLFHELGHCMHDILARTRFARHHGYAVCLELGEALASMLENWCWIKEDLKAMGYHYTAIDPKYMEAWKADHPGKKPPQAKLPDETLDLLISEYPRSKMALYTSILYYSQFDLAVHHPPSAESLRNLDESQTFRDLHEQFYFAHPPEPFHLQTDFSHLVSGYDAGYYVYMLANVFAQDMFSVNFSEDHRSIAAWDRYRRGLLEHGGSRDEKQVLKEFLGRTPNENALLKSLGLSQATDDRAE